MFLALVLSLAAVEMSLYILGGGALGNNDTGVSVGPPPPNHLRHVTGWEFRLDSIVLDILMDLGQSTSHGASVLCQQSQPAVVWF